jgi:hypothetical protein
MTWLREAPWMTAERVRLYGLAYAALAFAVLVDTVVALLGWRGDPPGDADFQSFHAAALMALDGQAAQVWDAAAHAARQVATQGPEVRIYAFFYPPIFLLFCLPLGLLPLLPAFAAWVLTTGAACFLALRRWLAQGGPLALLLAVLAPASVLNAVHGQNAYLTTALLAVAGLALDRRPGLAGAALASLVFKPQLGLLVIPALIAARRWAALGAAVVAGLAWVLAAWLAFGTEAWLAFLDRLTDAGVAMRGESVANWKMQSVQAMARSLGTSAAVAQALQLAAMAGALVALVMVIRRRPGGRAEIAVMAAAVPLASPFILSYDMMVLLLPMAWLLAEARRDGFLPWEKTALVAAYLMPGASIAAGLLAEICFGAIAPAILLALVLRRLRRR